MGKLQESRVGETNLNTKGTLMTIIEYNNVHDITVEFADGFRKKTKYEHFKSGSVKSPFDVSVQGVGYLGDGPHLATVGGKMTPQYRAWTGMMGRSYNEKTQERQPTYKGCSVDPRWHNFQAFAVWYDANYYEIEGKTIALDKDLLVKGNKVYGPDTCVFLPHDINGLFIKNNNLKNKTSSEAFAIYKSNKERVIKEMAELYKDMIPTIAYKAMIEYEVEAND